MKIIEMGNSSPDFYDIPLGATFLWFKQIEEKSEALYKNSGISIFSICSLARRCSNNDLDGFSELYKPLFRGSIDNILKERKGNEMWTIREEEESDDDLSMVHNQHGDGKSKGTPQRRRRRMGCGNFMGCICGCSKN